MKGILLGTVMGVLLLIGFSSNAEATDGFGRSNFRRGGIGIRPPLRRGAVIRPPFYRDRLRRGGIGIRPPFYQDQLLRQRLLRQRLLRNRFYAPQSFGFFGSSGLYDEFGGDLNLHLDLDGDCW